MYILGISAFYHDTASCLLNDGQIIAAAQEERFNRKKPEAGIPSHTPEYCVGVGGGRASKIASEVLYDNPLRTFDGMLSPFL